MIPTDSFTHSMTLGYHAGVEDDLQEPQITASEVEREILLDGWTDLIAGNGDWHPRDRSRARVPMLDTENDD